MLRQALEWVWGAQAPLQGSLLWPIDIVKYFWTWNLKDGSPTTQDAVLKDSRTTRSRISSEIYRRWAPNEFHKYVDWDPTRTEQGSWPTETTVNMWFKNDTNLATMFGMFGIVIDELGRGTLQTA